MSHEGGGAGSVPEDDEARDEWWRNLEFTPEQVERVNEEQRRKTEEYVRWLWGDRKPFPIPDTDTDA